MLTYLIDQVPLDDPTGRWHLLAKGTAYTPGLTMRSVNLSIPGVYGDLDTGPEVADAATMALRLSIDGADHAEQSDRLTLLKVLLRQASSISRDTGDPFTRVSQPCKLMSLAEPEIIGELLRLSAVLRLPTVTWRPAQPTLSLVGLGTHPLPALAGSTETVRDAVITVTGPAQNPILTDVASAATVQWLGFLADGHTLVLDCAAHTAITDGVDVSASLRFGPQPPAEFLPLTPTLTTDTLSTETVLTFAASSMTAATHVAVTAARAQL